MIVCYYCRDGRSFTHGDVNIASNNNYYHRSCYDNNVRPIHEQYKRRNNGSI